MYWYLCMFNWSISCVYLSIGGPRNPVIFQGLTVCKLHIYIYSTACQQFAQPHCWGEVAKFLEDCGKKFHAFHSFWLRTRRLQGLRTGHGWLHCGPPLASCLCPDIISNNKMWAEASTGSTDTLWQAIFKLLSHWGDRGPTRPFLWTLNAIHHFSWPLYIHGIYMIVVCHEVLDGKLFFFLKITLAHVLVNLQTKEIVCSASPWCCWWWEW